MRKKLIAVATVAAVTLAVAPGAPTAAAQESSTPSSAAASSTRDAKSAGSTEETSSDTEGSTKDSSADESSSDNSSGSGSSGEKSSDLTGSSERVEKSSRADTARELFDLAFEPYKLMFGVDSTSSQRLDGVVQAVTNYVLIAVAVTAVGQAIQLIWKNMPR